MAGGVMPIIKHIPGHGRSMVDSHFDLPRVETAISTCWWRPISCRSGRSTTFPGR